MSKKRLLIRLGALVGVLLLAVLMYFVGREHTILVDDKSVGDYKALATVDVGVDKQKSMELAARDRDKFVVTSQSHSITIKFTDSNWNEQTITRKFKVPVGLDTVIISLPTLAANPDAPQADWLAEYIPPTVVVRQDTTSETVNTEDSFSF
jgi:hypothetical protein